jgi:hypothetical protein
MLLNGMNGLRRNRWIEMGNTLLGKMVDLEVEC